MNHLNAIARIRAAMVLMPLILFMVMAGCTDKNLQAIADAENAIPQAVVVVANTSTTLVQQGSLSPSEGAAVAKILTDIVNANAHAVQATKAINSLTPTTKAQISGIVNPIIQEIQTEISSGDVFQIKNQNAKLAITTALTALTTTLQIIQSRAQ